MGLKQLEWHEGKNGAWVARVSFGERVFRRVAHVNLFDYISNTTRKQHKRKVPVMFTPVYYGAETHWFDSIEAAKLHVEAIFALDND